MANSIVRYTGADPNGETSVMSKITVTAAGLLNLAEIPKADSYTLRLWAKASGARNVTAYIGNSPSIFSVTTAWKEFRFTSATGANTSCELYLPTGTYYIWHPMLDKSTKASDYVQAPEDVDESINTAADNAVTAANGYTNEVLKEYSTTQEMRSEIKQTQSEIKLSVNEQITSTMTYAEVQAGNALTSAKADTDQKLKSYVTTTKHSADLTLLSDSISAAVTKTDTLAEYVDGDFYKQITKEYNAAIKVSADGIESTAKKTYATITTVNGIATRVTTAESSIKQNADSIMAAVKRLGTAESNITQNADSISSLVKTVNGHTTSINQNATNITSAVTRIGKAETSITQTASSLTALSKTVDGHTSSITQNANAIKLRVETSKLVSEINASSGTISMKSNRFTVDSTNFKLTANGTITATSATLNSATITGSLKTTVTDSTYLYTHGNQMEFFRSNKRLAYITPVMYSNTYHQLGIMASGNYDGITLGATFDGGWEAYYRINIQSAASNMGCRHWFAGDMKFTGNIKSRLNMSDAGINFSDNYGLSWGGNIALRYYNAGSPIGVWLGIENEYTCPTILTGSEIRLRRTAYTSSGVVVSSDARQKKNIKDLDSRYTTMLENITAKTFQYKETDPNKTNCGFVAQEVLAAMKKAGLEPKDFGGFHDHYGDGSEYSLDYVQFIPILWEIVKNQQAEIAALRRILL